MLAHTRLNRPTLANRRSPLSVFAGTVSVLALGLAAAVPARAQSTDASLPDRAAANQTDDAEASAPEIIVTGLRASLGSALAIKRNTNQIVDSIVAEDIGKFPDANAAESLQRITGIQISRTKSEGTGVSIRGLSNVRLELNGRSYYSGLADIPSELIAGIDVYKSFSAEQPEGGLGGLINIRTRRPFDFNGFTLSTAVGANYYENVAGRGTGDARPRLSGLISDRWDTGIGEMGLLVDVSYQRTKFTRFGNTVQPYSSYTNLGGQAGIAPVGIMENPYEGGRERLGIQASFQWQASDRLQLYIDGNFNDYHDHQNTHAIVVGSQNVNSQLTPDPNGTFTFSNGNLQTGSFVNVPVEAFSYIGDNSQRTAQGAIGGTWKGDRLKIEADVSYTRGWQDGENDQLSFGTTVPSATFDLTGSLPTATIVGADLTNTSLWHFNYFYKLGQPPIRQEEKAARLDVHYTISDTGFLRQVNAGGRYTNASVKQDGYFAFYGAGPLAGQPISAFPAASWGLYGSDTFGQYVSPNPDFIRDEAGPCAAFAISPCTPANTPTSHKAITEKILAGYVTADFGLTLAGVDVLGTAGVRLVNTKTSVLGVSNPSTGVYENIVGGGSDTTALPSVNIHANLAQNLTLRAAFSRSLSRISQGDLNPVVVYNPNYGTGSAGNPNLRPFSATNFDVSLERYLGRSGIAYIAGFYKRVNGFLQNVTSPETIDGQVYQITRPQNGGTGDIKGFETGVQTFFDFLPAPFDGFGTQLNYTYVKSSAPGPVAGEQVPLTGLSKNSYNLIGIYEKGIVSARLAYNWRDTYVVTTSAYGAGSSPIYAHPYGQLDASLTFNFSDKVSVTLDAVNLNGVHQRTYYGTPDRPYETYTEDRRYGIMFRSSF